MNTKRKTAAVYIRVSTDRQEELSPDAQLRLAKEYASANNLIIPDDYIYMDIGISGKQAGNRPKFQEMIATAKLKNHPFDVVLLWKFSRFARSQDEAAYYKSILRKKCGVDVISVTEPIAEGIYGRLIEMIIEWNDEFYSYNLSQEVFKGMSEKALRGGYQARPPLGYRIEKRKQPPVVVPAEAKIVQLIFQKYALEGTGIFDIAKELNRLGLKTARGREFERRSVAYILNNPTYCGYIRWNRTSNNSKERKPQSEWIIAKGQHEPIISEELFQKAAKRLENESAPRQARPSSTYKHWLSGLPKCPSCGRVMICSHSTPRRNGKIYYNFICSGYSKGKCAEKNQISAIRLETAVLTALAALDKNSLLRYQSQNSDAAQLQTELALYQQQLELLEKKSARIKDSYQNGIDSLEEYKQNKTQIRIKKERLTKKIKLCQEQKNKGSKLQENLRTPLQFFSSEQIDAAIKNQALKQVIEKIIYTRQTDCVQIYFYEL